MKAHPCIQNNDKNDNTSISQSNWWKIQSKKWACLIYSPRYPGGCPSSLILLSQGGGSSSCVTYKTILTL